MTSKIGCVFNVYESKTTVSDHSSIPTCTIEIHIRHRYQLKLPSDRGYVFVIEDVMAPEYCTSFRIPIVLPLSLWRELYLSDILKSLNLDASVHNYLKPKIAEAAVLLAERNGNKGFAMVAKVGILKAELMSKEEFDRIASEFMEMESGNPFMSVVTSSNQGGKLN